MADKEDLVKVNFDFESDIDDKIVSYLAGSGSGDDLISIDEKRIIIRELALCNKKSEIVPLLNELRAEKGLPELSKTFDIYYYQKKYSDLIESISLEYAQNLAKKYRFANRIVRVAKLNEVAEGILDRINARQAEMSDGSISQEAEKLHLSNIKVFRELINAVDEQMGKLKITKIDVNVAANKDKPMISGAEDIKQLIVESMKKYATQLPSSVDANFTDTTDYVKCDFAEQWSGGVTHCTFFNEKCKVQTGDFNVCPHFLNRVALSNKEIMTTYRDNDLSARQIAELTGCKQVEDRQVEKVRGYLKEHGLWNK